MSYIPTKLYIASTYFDSSRWVHFILLPTLKQYDPFNFMIYYPAIRNIWYSHQVNYVPAHPNILYFYHSHNLKFPLNTSHTFLTNLSILYSHQLIIYCSNLSQYLIFSVRFGVSLIPILIYHVSTDFIIYCLYFNIFTPANFLAFYPLPLAMV